MRGKRDIDYAVDNSEMSEQSIMSPESSIMSPKSRNELRWTVWPGLNYVLIYICAYEHRLG
jgi:hypothetical protein